MKTIKLNSYFIDRLKLTTSVKCGKINYKQKKKCTVCKKPLLGDSGLLTCLDCYALGSRKVNIRE